jgi:hypothetical protein
VTLPQAAYDAAPMLPPEGSVRGPCLLGSLSYLVDTFDWERVPRPRRTLEETVIMELDVAGFTTGGRHTELSAGVLALGQVCGV